MPRFFRNRIRPPSDDRHLPGLGVALSVFLVLFLVKYGAFFTLHPQMLHADAEAPGGTSMTLAGVTPDGIARR